MSVNERGSASCYTSHMLYRLNLACDGEIFTDEEGVELPNLETACFRATRIAREIIGEEAKSGRLPLCWSIEITDETGVTVATMPFADTVTLR
ncbi:DUF6894 family protein [Sphingomonas sp. PWP1-2]|uniref:DUF6894 family protein n=1 Tax=Sphingomonas sp. PWP1-2 TaxID=2804558 RepID=UPI003CEA200F